MSNHHTQAPSPGPTPHLPEAGILEPDLLLAAALDALQGMVEEGHFHRRGRGIRCPAKCQAARKVLALAGRLPFAGLSREEQVAVLSEESGALRRDVREMAARVAAVAGT